MGAFELSYCPVCDGADQGFTVLDTGTFPAIRCRGCSLGIEQRLSVDPVGVYARDAYDGVRNAGAGGSRWQRYHHDSAVAVSRLSQLGSSLPSGSTWVDVGCSSGALLTVLRRRNWRVLGVEADIIAAEEVIRAVGVPVIDYRSWLATASRSPREDQKVDVVSMFDVIEHLLDPVGTLQIAANSLHHGGVLVVEVPDFDVGLKEPEWSTQWKHRRITETFTEHIWHFSEQTLEQIRVRHLKNMIQVRLARPVHGRLQIVWKKDCPPPTTTSQISPAAIAIELLRQPRVERLEILKRMAAGDPGLHREVSAAVRGFEELADTSV